jgi:hypothetical protein
MTDVVVVRLPALQHALYLRDNLFIQNRRITETTLQIQRYTSKYRLRQKKDAPSSVLRGNARGSRTRN